jgi:geranylgeranyl diphosphate synthase type II
MIFNQYYDFVNKSLSSLIESLGESSIYDPIKYFLNLPSKRIRPIATLISNKLFNNDDDFAIPAALANEVFHNFTLVHDDIMDSSAIRRGKDTVHIKWNLNQAILSGDSMLILSYKLLEKYDSEIQKELLKLFNETALLICEGQQLDLDFEQKNDIDYENYLKMIKYKTAVLLASSLKMGGIINSASSADSDALYECGINIGLAFQIQDDYLDLFGNQDKIGKRVGGDVIENKKTILYHMCKRNSNSEQLDILNHIYNLKEIKGKVQKAKSLFIETKADESTKDLVKYYSDLALESIEKIQIESNLKEDLISLINLLLERRN